MTTRERLAMLLASAHQHMDGGLPHPDRAEWYWEGLAPKTRKRWLAVVDHLAQRRQRELLDELGP